MKVGNGANTRFWLDNWIGNDTLKTLFPRLFAISTQQNNLIQEMGIWEEKKWVWNFTWRRRLFAWEEDLEKDLYLALDHESLSESDSVRDVRMWTYNKSTSFSVSDFYLLVTRILGQERNHFFHGRMAWRNVAPPRAQLLVWFVLQGRLNTRQRLFRFGFPGVEDEICVLCREEPETIDHIIFNCRFSSSLWYFGCNRWNLTFYMSKDPTSCFITWMDTPFKRFDKKIWSSLFYVISWSIWWLRNKVIFEKMKSNWDVEKKLIFWRLGLWIKGWCPNFPYSPGKVCEDLPKQLK